MGVSDGSFVDCKSFAVSAQALSMSVTSFLPPKCKAQLPVVNALWWHLTWNKEKLQKIHWNKKQISALYSRRYPLQPPEIFCVCVCVLTRFWWYYQAIGFLLHIFPVPAGRGRFVVTFLLIQILLRIASSMKIRRSPQISNFQDGRPSLTNFTLQMHVISYWFIRFNTIYIFCIINNDPCRSSTLPCESMAPRLLHVDEKQSRSRFIFILKNAKILRARNVKDGFLLYY